MEIKEEVRTIRYIDYDGLRFYEDGKGYWIGRYFDEDGKSIRIRLHIYVWEKHNGRVPEGYDVHHIDHDPSNNEIDNLVAMPRSEHHKLHIGERDVEDLRFVIDTYVRPKASQWHRSEKGKTWHKEQYEKTLAPKWDEQVSMICQYCGGTYAVSPLMQHKSRFCSNKCRTAWRYREGVDNTERVCSTCGKTFIVNKYSRTKNCSRECALRQMVQTKTEVHRQRK